MQCHNPSQCSVFDSGHLQLTESMVIKMLINLSQNTYLFLFLFFSLKYDLRLDRPNLTVKNKITVLSQFS